MGALSLKLQSVVGSGETAVDDPVRCAQCSAEIEFWQDKCPVCGTFIGFPNVRKAQQEQEVLYELYESAVDLAEARGADGKVKALERHVDGCTIVVNMSVDIIYNMVRDPARNYISYYRLVDAEARKAAKEQHHVDRGVADAALFPKYFGHIVYGALSCDGSGLANYGAIGVSLKDEVAPLRVSLLIENSFHFMKKHFKYGQPLPPGYRAEWTDRARLAVVKHAPSLSPATPDSDINKLILRAGPDRDEDEFIEVHIYDGFDKRAIERIVLDRVPTHPHYQKRWQELKELLVAEKIDFDEAGAKP